VPFTPAEVSRLAALSRAFREARRDIHAAIVQEMGEDLSPEHRADVGIAFGLTEEEFVHYLPENVSRVYDGYIHRAGLRSVGEVVAAVLRHVEIGRLKPGDQLPPRTAFGNLYYCNKKTHAEAVARLTAIGVVHRPGGTGGPVFVL